VLLNSGDAAGDLLSYRNFYGHFIDRAEESCTLYRYNSLLSQQPRDEGTGIGLREGIYVTDASKALRAVEFHLQSGSDISINHSEGHFR
jgi:hypothetical protein